MTEGVEIDRFPFEVPAGGKVTFDFEEYERVWSIGDQIDVTPDECQAVAMSLSLLGNQMLSDFLREMNVVLGIADG